jgi:hypothetical protein
MIEERFVENELSNNAGGLILLGVSLDDFIKGVTAGLAMQGVTKIEDELLDMKLVIAFNEFHDICEQDGPEVRFHLELNPFTQLTHSGRMALDRAAEKGLLIKKSDSWDVLISSNEAERILAQLPCSLSTWEKVASQMI